MTEPNTLDEQVDELIEKNIVVDLRGIVAPNPPEATMYMAFRTRILDGLKTDIKTLFTEHSKQEVIKFVAMLDEQDPYIPLDGTPRQYVHDKLNEYLELSKRNKGEDNE